MWLPIKLKADETQFFLDQLRAHARFPRQFLFYLSAFLSSARSITFHLQKQFHQEKELYDKLVTEMLSDQVCQYFVNSRNYIEKEGYLPVEFEIRDARKNEKTGELIWVCRASWALTPEYFEEGLASIEKMIANEWDLTSLQYAPADISYQWKFIGYPGSHADVVSVCDEFANRLWYFIAEFRASWESKNDPDAWSKKFDIAASI